MKALSMALTACTTLVPTLLSAQGAGLQGREAQRLRPGMNVSVRLTDGSAVYGQLTRIGMDSVVLTSLGGRQAYAASSVKSVRNAGEARTSDDGTVEYWIPNSNTTRLFFGPTGRVLPQGEGYAANHMVLFGSVAYGFHDRVTLGAGSMLLPGTDVWFVTPKVGIVQSEKVNLAAGALVGSFGLESMAGIGFIAATFGSTDDSFTLAVGNAFMGSQPVGDRIVMIGAETRLSRRTAFVTENYIFAGEAPVISYGVRMFGEKLSVDLAFFNTLGEGMVFPGIPYVDFVIRF
jgi:hypothetical protein